MKRQTHCNLALFPRARGPQRTGLPAGPAAADEPAAAAAPYWLVVLNQEAADAALLAHLWRGAAAVVCADGALNRLRGPLLGGLVPDAVVGDMDSADPAALEAYRARGGEVVRDEDQDRHDLDKALLHVLARAPDGSEAVVFGALGGRFDHQMAAVSSLHQHTASFARLLVVSPGCGTAELLLPGREHVLRPHPAWEGPTCGLLPVGEPCREVRTAGLRWNLDGDELRFGALVSTSNLLAAPEVRVTTDRPLLWTAALEAAAEAAPS